MAYEIKPKKYWGLNILIVILVGVLLAVLLIPKQIWNEEQRYRDLSRQRMQNLWKVENLFHQLTGDYTELGSNAIRTVNVVYDSLQDSTDFYGEQTVVLPSKTIRLTVDSAAIVNLIDSSLADTVWTAHREQLISMFNNAANGDSTQSGQLALMAFQAAYDSLQAKPDWRGTQSVVLPFRYTVDVPDNYIRTYDTTFVATTRTKEVVADTSYLGSMVSDETTGEVDSTWFPRRDLNDMLDRYPNLFIVDTSITRQDRWVTATTPDPPDLAWTRDSLTGKKYIIKKSADGLHLRIQSPIKGEFKERRYYVFTFSDTSHGYVEDGEPSWKEQQ